MIVCEIIFAVSLALILYTWIGYPALALLLSRVLPRPVRKSDITPAVSVIITAHNEERDIAAKLDNTLALDYPADKLEVIVASDCSTDRTDEIVRGYAARGVILSRQCEHFGKTVAQNAARRLASGEILVFSDATTLYAPDALRRIVRSFADPEVGCVAGQLVYVDGKESATGQGCRSYWGYEKFIKRCESLMGSLIGVSGCLYAVRRSNYARLEQDMIDDFVIASEIHLQGLRTVYEPEAIALEDTNQRGRDEFRMRVRVIEQTISALHRYREVLNPLRHGMYAWSMWSHKVLRYGVVLLLLAMLLSSAALLDQSWFYTVAFSGQVALYFAAFAGVIALEAGAEFIGNFVLPKKNGNNWIIIRTAAEAKLPPAGTRLTPSAAGALPKLLSPNGEAALKTAPGAHHYRLIGLEIGLAPKVGKNYGIVQFGDDSQSRLEAVPHDLIIDRCWIHGNATGDVSRGVSLNSARTAVIDSSISDCHGVGFDTQAIAGWNGPGPFRIVNNYLEGAGENVMFGGADPKIANLVPSDIEFRQNYCFKPLAWKPGDPAYAGTHWSVKNIFELKNAQRVLIDGNIFEHNWVDAQNGYSILFTVRNQDGGAPWSVVQDVTFTNNIVRGVSSAINMLGRDYNYPSGQLARVKIRNNLFDQITWDTWGGRGHFLLITNTQDVKVENNTVMQSGNLLTAYGDPLTTANKGFVFQNNIAPHNNYGVIGDGTSTGIPTLSAFYPGATFAGNVLAGGQSPLYPTGNYFPGTLDEIGFTDRDNGNYRLSAASPFRNRGTNGRDPGVDLDELNAAQPGRDDQSRLRHRRYSAACHQSASTARMR